MHAPYDAVIARVIDAGFFATPFEEMGGWNRVTFCGRRRPNGRYAGKSSWVAFASHTWLIGAWGGSVYGLEDDSRIGEACVAWLEMDPDDLPGDFDESFKRQFALRLIDDDELKSLTT